MAVSIKADLTAFRRLERGLKGTSRLSRLRAGGLLRQIAEDLLASTERRFETQSAPDQRFWKSLAPATLAGRPKGKGPGRPQILRDSNRLFQSLTYRLGRDGLEIGTNVIYAAIHQFGGKAGRGHTITIPARPYLGLSSGDVARINRRVNRFLRRIAPDRARV